MSASVLWMRKEVSGKGEHDVHPQLLDLEQQYKNCVWTINTRLPVKLRMNRKDVRVVPLYQIADQIETDAEMKLLCIFKGFFLAFKKHSPK